MISTHEHGPISCGQDLLPKLDEIGQRGLRTARERYSSGFPDYEGGSELKLGYNNMRHGVITGRDTKRLLGRLGFSLLDQELGRITGEVHDQYQLGGRGIDEARSAEWVERQLRNVGAPTAIARRSRKGVKGTEPILSDTGVVLGQMATEQEYDSVEDEAWCLSLSCGDLSEFPTRMGPLTAQGLYAQKCNVPADEAPPLDKLQPFYGGQLTMLSDYKYPLVEAEELFATHRAQVYNYTNFLYEQAGRGAIEWDRLTDWNLRFMNNPDINLSRLN